MIDCEFELNDKPMSTLKCGALSFPAFSGRGIHVNRRISACHKDVGPIPPGTYYILDREPGGLFGPFRNLFNDKAEWFALYAVDSKIDDETYCNEVKRGNFRLHPKGRLGISNGCITIESQTDFRRLRAILKSQTPITISGSVLKAYGQVVVK